MSKTLTFEVIYTISGEEEVKDKKITYDTRHTRKSKIVKSLIADVPEIARIKKIKRIV